MQLNNLERAFDDVKKQLFDQLHDILRSQLFVASTESRTASPSLSPTLALPSPSSGIHSNGSPNTSHPQSEEDSESSSNEGSGEERDARNETGGRHSEAVRRD